MRWSQHSCFLFLQVIVVVGLLMLVQPAAAQSPAPGPADPAEVEAFLDGVMSAQMESNHIAGAVVIVVKDGELFFSKGYGYADLEQQILVDPAATMFRPGSVSKLFVWTAIMQQVEQGKLSLDADINDYLDFTIPDTYPEPITVRHLMSHTPGFEDISQGLFKLSADEMQPLGEYLKTNLPVRVYPPGEVGAYSNFGTALAGYIVERASGQPFVEYVEQHIFAPLGMEHSTFRQPLPANLAPHMSKGYNFVDGGYVEGAYEYVLPYPAGSLSAGAHDIAAFMIAHLQHGAYGASRILKDETARQMQQQLFTPDPRLSGMAHGFLESSVNGLHILSHGGDTILFHTGLYLIPEKSTGLYISTNSTGGAGAGDAVMRAFMDRYYPVETATTPAPPAGFEERITPYLGSYTLSRSNFTSFEKIMTLMTPVNATLNEEGYLVVSLAGQAKQYTEVEPGLLQERYDPSVRMVYRSTEDGQMALLPAGPHALMKAPWHGSSGLHGMLLVGGLLLFLGTLMSWLSAFLGNLRQREPRASWARLARLTAALFGLLFLLFILGLLAVFMDIDPAYGVPRVFFTTPPVLNTLLVFPLLMLIAALTMPVFALLAWKNKWWRARGRMHYTLLAVVALALVWVMAYWNFL